MVMVMVMVNFYSALILSDKLKGAWSVSVVSTIVRLVKQS